MSPGSLTLQHMSEDYSFLRINNIPLYVYYHILLTHSSIKGYLGFFPVLAAVYDAAVNMDIQISLQVPLFSYFGYISRSWIVESSVQFSSVQSSHSVTSNSLQPHGLQHARLPCPSPTPRACSNSCPLSWWWHPTISSSVVPFSSHPQSFPASVSFQMSQFLASDGQSIGVSASASVLPINIQDWFSLGLTGLISLPSKGLSRVFSNTTVQKHQFFSAQLSLWSNSHIHTWLLEKL